MFKRLKRVSTRIVVAMGADLRLRTPDRHVLENLIFPYFSADPLFQRILFVGCDWYTRGYASIFRAKEYWTMEPKHSRRWFGSALHIEDFCQHGGGALDLDTSACSLSWEAATLAAGAGLDAI